MPNVARGRSVSVPGSGRGAAGLRVVALLLGVFFLAQGSSKYEWFTDSGILEERFEQWSRGAPASVRWYIETLAVPGIPVLARLVPLAELTTGAALLVGFWTRFVGALAFVMVLNFHFASGLMHRWEFLREGTALPVLGGLLALAIGGAKLPFSASE